MEPAKGLKEPVKRMAALIKGSVPDCTAADFPADPEEACKRLHVFLSVWFPATNNKKEDERKAFSEACNRLKLAEVRQIVNSLHSYKTWLLRKQRNLKTGEKTDAVIRSLFAALQKEMPKTPGISKGSSSSQELPAACQPAKRLNRKQSLVEKVEESPKAKPGKALRFAFSSPGDLSSPGALSSVVSISSGELVAPGSMSENEGDEPEKAAKKPASKGGSKRPASKKEEKLKKPAKAAASKPAKASSTEPAEAESQAAKPDDAESQQAEPGEAEKQEAQAAKPAKAAKPANAKGEKRPWVPSESFGFVHQTRASKKAYIRARQEMADKEYCLVNIEIPQGEKQTQVMDDLFAKAQEAGWTKETLVHHKQKMLQA